MQIASGFDQQFRRLSTLGFAGTHVTPHSVDMLGNDKGAYILIIQLNKRVETNIKSLGNPSVPAGWYYYAGSAMGGGGIKSRLRRHLSPDKKPHWHIDHLTNAASNVEALAVPEGHECGIIDKLLASNQFLSPVTGFGSSDCRICKSHLLRTKN